MAGWFLFVRMGTDAATSVRRGSLVRWLAVVRSRRTGWEDPVEGVVAEVAELVVERVVHGVHADVAPEPVEPFAPGRRARARHLEHPLGDAQAGPAGGDLGVGHRHRHYPAGLGGERIAGVPGGVEAGGGLVGQQARPLDLDRQLAVAAEHVGILAGPGGERGDPGPRLGPRVAPRLAERTLGQPEVDVGQDELGQAGPQRGEGAAQRARAAQDLLLGHRDVVELDGAAVGLPLPEAIPVPQHPHARPARGDERHNQLAPAGAGDPLLAVAAASCGSASRADTIRRSESEAPEQKLLVPRSRNPPPSAAGTSAVRRSSGLRALPQNQRLLAVWRSSGSHWARVPNRRTVASIR